jgi:two-component system response regulator HydG
MNERADILIADDNQSLCRTMSLTLKRKGYGVTVAKDGAEALERVRERPFDMIFMDVKMPLMDGVETYKRIKEIRPEAVVMMMTAYAVEELVQEALKEGAYGVVYKPVDIDKVVSLIEEGRASNHGALILVVDDDSGTCTTLRNILVKRSYRVGVAQSGEEAINMARQRAYDIIFIDVKLPTINGLETYLRLKEVNPEAVAVMMTGYREEVADLVDRALSHSAYTCLHKPLDMSETLRLVEDITARKKEPV